MGYIKDCLIIRGNFDPYTEYTSYLGEGLKEKLETMRWSVIDLCGDEATPSNVHYWLRERSRRISKAVIYFGHGYKDRLTGQHDGEEITVIDRKNVETMTKYLDVFTFAPATAVPGAIGDYAVKCGCHSWFGYSCEDDFSKFLNQGNDDTLSVDNSFNHSSEINTELLKQSIWKYITSLASRKPLRECRDVFEENCRGLSASPEISRLLTENIRLINKYD